MVISWIIYLIFRCEIVNININQKPEWFIRSKNPLGTVPVLQIDETNFLRDPMIITEYLDEAYAKETQLIPRDPLNKAKAKHLIAELCRVCQSTPRICSYMFHKFRFSWICSENGSVIRAILI